MRNNPLGYLTISMVQEYDHCPRQYFYEYVEGYKPVLPNVNLVFGSIMHEAIAEGLRTGYLSADTFLKRWKAVGDLQYSGRDTHKSLEVKGVKLVEKLLEAEVLKLDVEAIEKAYETELPDGTLFKGTADLIYKVKGERILLDWKTSGSSFFDCRPHLDDQLTAYSFLSGVSKVAYGVLLKKKDPEVRFYFSSRKEEDYLDLQVKTMKTASDIERGFFYKNPSPVQCSLCPFCSLCLGKVPEVAGKELVKAEVKDRYANKKLEKVLVA